MIHQTTIPKSILPENLSASELKMQASGLEVTDTKTHTIIETETKGRAEEPFNAGSDLARWSLATKTFTDLEPPSRHGFIDKHLSSQPYRPTESFI